MKIADAIQQAINLIPGFSAAQLAKDADINKGQLSAFLNKAGPMSDEKQADLVNALLTQLNSSRLSDEIEKKIHPFVADLAEFGPYQARYKEPDPYSHTVFGWSRYIERDIESEIHAALERRPFVIALTSGPKTGKSSIAKRLVSINAKVGNTIYLDGQKYANSGTTDLVEWIFQTASAQLGVDFDEHPDSWESMVDWLKQDMLIGKNPVCTFVFDHIEKLGDAYMDLSSGWHYVLNQTRDEPSLKGLGLILVFDPASPVLYKAKNISSRLEQRSRFFVPENLTKGQVDRLLKSVLASTSWNKQLTEDVWAMFQGHLFLTHVYAHTYGDSKPDEAAEKADQETRMAFQKTIAAALKAGVYSETLAAHFGQAGSELGGAAGTTDGIKPVKPAHALLLHDSGLFFERGYGDNATLHCTPWIRQRLIEAFSGGESAE